MCLLTNERYKTFKTEFSFGPLGHACPRVWDLGRGGGGSKNKFSEHGHVAYQIKGDEQ